MKYFFIPAALLALLLGTALWNAAAVDASIAPWCDALSQAQEEAEREDWDAAARTLRETREAWGARQVYFHIVTAHDELEAADALFAAAEVYAAARDVTEFRASVAQLSAQLRVVAEMQRLTLRNVL